MAAGDDAVRPGLLSAHRSRGGAVLVAALAVDSVGNGLFLPLSLVYFTRLTDVPLSQVGILLSVATALTVPVPALTGTLADRFGALPLVVGAQLLQAAGYLAYAVGVHGAVGIFVASFVTAVGVRVFWSSIFTAVADYAEGSGGGDRDGTGGPRGSGAPRTTDSWYAVVNAARTAGLAAGGLVTGAVVASGDVGTYRAVAVATAVCFAGAAVAIAIAVRTPARAVDAEDGEAPEDRRRGYAGLVRDRPFLALIGINTVLAMSTMMLGLALPTVVLDTVVGPAWLTSAVLVGNAVLISVVSVRTARLVARYRRTTSLAVAACLWVAWALLMAPLSPDHLRWTVPLLLAATLLYTAADVVHGPVSSALAAAAAPADARGRYLATFQYSFALASVVAPAFFTTLHAWHSALPWVALAALDGACVPAVLALARHLPATAVGGGARTAR